MWCWTNDVSSLSQVSSSVTWKNPTRPSHVPLCFSSSVLPVLPQKYCRHRLLVFNPSSHHSPFWGPFRCLRRETPLFSMIHGWQYGRSVWGSHVSNLWFLKRNMTANPTLLSCPLIQSPLDQWPQKNLSASSFSFHQTDVAFIYSTNIYRISSK